MLYLHATNVHQGGGESLLKSLMSAFSEDHSYVLTLDARMQYQQPLNSNVTVKRVNPSVFSRFLAEVWLAYKVKSDDVVLCFGNLPPIFRLRGHTVVFLQNRYLVEKNSIRKLPLKQLIRLMIERLWLLNRMTNVNEFLVQTATMKRLLKKVTKGLMPVSILPFAEHPDKYTRSISVDRKDNSNNYDYIYVATGDPHKNHIKLIDAWCVLSEEGLFPSLCLTLDEKKFPDICSFLYENIKKYNLNIKNFGEAKHDVVLSLYKKSNALIYPSKLESFGLPLIEARQANLSILAAELDYVRDLIEPEQTFNPDSSVSIARAVKRHLNIREEDIKLLNSADFLSRVMERK